MLALVPGNGACCIGMGPYSRRCHTGVRVNILKRGLPTWHKLSRCTPGQDGIAGLTMRHVLRTMRWSPVIKVAVHLSARGHLGPGVLIMAAEPIRRVLLLGRAHRLGRARTRRVRTRWTDWRSSAPPVSLPA